MKDLIKLIIITFISSLICIVIYNNSKVPKAVKEDHILVVKQNEIEKSEDLMLKDEHTFDNLKVVLNPYKISPLTALIMFKTNDSTSVNIKVVGKDSNTSLEYSFPMSNDHYIPVYGLYPDHNNEIIITVNNVSKSVFIKTEPLPKDFILAKINTSDKSKLKNEFYFVSPSGKANVAGYDINGDVRWYLNEKLTWDVKTLKNGKLLIGTNRLLNPPYYTTGLFEMDYLGKIYYEYTVPGGYHHDVYEMPNGNLLVGSNDFKDGTVEDVIVEIDRKTANIVKKFDLKKILKMDDAKSEDWVEYDWFHNNSVWYDIKTNSIILSGRHQDAVISINYENSKLNWIIGDSTNWSEEYQKYFFKPTNNLEWQWSQHAASVLPNGNIFIFDNGNNKSKLKDNYVNSANSYSRGVIYNINTNNMTINQVWEYGKARGSSYYSPYISDVDYINNNHYLIHSGGVVLLNGIPQNKPASLTKFDAIKSYTTEILNNEVIFEMELNGNYYRAEKMFIYENCHFNLNPAIRIGKLDETKKKDKNPLLIFTKLPDDNFKKYNISLFKELDRLVVKGNFKKDDKVEIILDNMFDKRTYDVRISTKPYTAMCIGTFNENNELAITQYINDTNLKGKYYVYIKINNVIYRLDQYVSYD